MPWKQWTKSNEVLFQMSVDETSTLLIFNLAPLGLRRDIAMLGQMHRTVLGQKPAHFQICFSPKIANTDAARNDQGTSVNCTNTWKNNYLDTVGHSALGLARIYNLLPNEITETNNVKTFQRLLQDPAKDCASLGIMHWPHRLRTRYWLHEHPLQKY